ncbi:HNH endonuclease [Marinoscillum sp. 108]|uniref:HNH endonuclease n=1 Tax=Marinoscillum sp. 108 TaxID=2653151 RepID=UPI001359B2D9|nr:HNH endonuclease [Marinoscillum sp. 108]
MQKHQQLWTREELILAINLYCKLPFGKMHSGNPDIVELARLLGRTSGAVAYKLVNFASLDPSLQARGIKGADHTSKLDKEIWAEFYANWDQAVYESEVLLGKKKGILEASPIIESDFSELDGGEKERFVKTRINQSFFRKTILASYNNTCCITGINLPELLIAGHIVPWSIDEKNRLNPSNGLAMNGLHDKAFELGLISISPEYKILISPSLKKNKNQSIKKNFLAFEGKEIITPTKFLPDPSFLLYHNEKRLRK